MQYKKQNKKVIALALAGFILTSSIGTEISFANTIEQTESISAEQQESASSQNQDNTTNSSDGYTNENGEFATSEDVSGLNEAQQQNSGTEDSATLDGYEVNVEGKAIKTAAQKLNGFVKDGNKWRFYVNNVQVKGWVDYKGIKYYIINTYALPQNMWRNIKGYKYYFNKDGVMIKNQKILIDGKEYQFDGNGHLINNNNSVKVGVVSTQQQEEYKKGEQILIDSANNGKNFVKNGLFSEEGKWYKYENGNRTRGWFKDGNKTYFFLNTLNRAESMWRAINGKKYYFEADGTMVANKIRYIDGKTYFFNADGSLNTNVKTTLIQKDVDVRRESNNSSAVVGRFIKGNGVRILQENSSFAKVQSADGTISGWIPSSSYIGESEKKINNVIAVAKSKIGSSYVWGATGPNSFDCSGLMLYSFKNGANITLPRVSRQQATVGRYVSRSELKPGDLIFWGSPVHHVGMYLGDGKYIHAPEPGTSVRISTLGSYTTARRIIQ